MAFNEQDDLDLVVKYFASRGLLAERFHAAEVGRDTQAQTPDFRIQKNGHLLAYCEVKSPAVDRWLDDQLDKAGELELVGGCRHDPVFNRIASHVTKAIKQFKAVNPDRVALNILAHVNHDEASHFGDLQETLTGYFHADDGTKHLTMPQVAGGRIREAWVQVDCFLWFGYERDAWVLEGILLNLCDEGRRQRVRALLAIDPQNPGKKWRAEP